MEVFRQLIFEHPQHFTTQNLYMMHFLVDNGDKGCYILIMMLLLFKHVKLAFLGLTSDYVPVKHLLDIRVELMFTILLKSGESSNKFDTSRFLLL